MAQMISIIKEQSEIHGHVAEIAVLAEIEKQLTEIDRSLARRIMDYILANIGCGAVVGTMGVASYIAASALSIAGSPLLLFGAAMFGAGLFLQKKGATNA